jgi:CRISPR-associated endoribonuclease Cas6
MAACWYAAAFDSPAQMLMPGVLPHGDRHYPHPFYMAAGELRPRLERGTEISCMLSVFGNPNPLLGKIVDAMSEAGHSSNWGGRFRIERLVSLTNGLLRVVSRSAGFDPRRNQDWPKWEAPSRQDAGTVTMTFETPLRLRIKGRLQSDPSFSEIIRALLRRIHLLVRLYSHVELEPGWAHGLIESAATVTTRRSHWQLIKASRMSGRQERRIPLDGWLGRVELSGSALGGLFPFLDAGRYVGIGSGTSHGFGCYALDSGGGR